MHKSHGYDFKPRVCRAYPFQPVRTPGGLFVGLSFACESVLADSGRAIAEQADEIRDLVKREPEMCVDIEEPVRFDAWRERTGPWPSAFAPATPGSACCGS